MTSRRSTAAFALAALLAALAPAAAHAGASSLRGLMRVEVARGGAIVVTAGTNGEALRRLRLAQVRTVPTYRTGRGCGTHATDYDIAELALSRRLARSLRAIPRRGGGFYVESGTIRGLRIARTLNAELLRRGLARVAGLRSGRYRAALVAAQAGARRAHRGIWSRCRRGRPPRARRTVAPPAAPERQARPPSAGALVLEAAAALLRSL